MQAAPIDTLLFIGGMLLIVGLIASPAALLVWVMRRKLDVTVLGPEGPVAGATVRAHATRRSGADPAGNPHSETVTRDLGRTDAQGRLRAVLLLTHPWGLTASKEGVGESELRVLPAPERGQTETVRLTLRRLR